MLRHRWEHSQVTDSAGAITALQGRGALKIPPFTVFASLRFYDAKVTFLNLGFVNATM